MSGLSLTSPSKSPQLSVVELFTIDPTPVLKRAPSDSVLVVANDDDSNVAACREH